MAELTQAIWWEPHLFILDGNNAIRVSLPLLCHWVKSHKIEPKAKHLSHCKKYQSSWPNQTDNSKRNTKIPNHAYNNLEEIQIIFIDKLIINQQFVGSRRTHRKRILHRIELQEHCICRCNKPWVCCPDCAQAREQDYGTRTCQSTGDQDLQRTNMHIERAKVKPDK